jgi:acyl-CoA synthetase (AMP-forming)/AMP-acid ligase II
MMVKKGVMVSHVNVIAHMLMVAAFEGPTRSPDQRDVILGLLPQSHIYGLVVISHDGVYRGDSIIVMPKFELNTLLASIQRFKINVLIMVKIPLGIRARMILIACKRSHQQ